MIDPEGRRHRRAEPRRPARSSTVDPRSGRLPGPVHRRAGTSKSASLGRRNSIRRRRSAIWSWRKQGPCRPCPSAAADARRGPPGSKCDIKPWPARARRPSRLLRQPPYTHLRTELERCLNALHETGEITDPRQAQITRLETENAKRRERLAQSQQTVEELADFRTQALARLAAPARGNRPASRHRRHGKPSQSTSRTSNHSDRQLQLTWEMAAPPRLTSWNPRDTAVARDYCPTDRTEDGVGTGQEGLAKHHRRRCRLSMESSRTANLRSGAGLEPSGLCSRTGRRARHHAGGHHRPAASEQLAGNPGQASPARARRRGHPRSSAQRLDTRAARITLAARPIAGIHPCQLTSGPREPRHIDTAGIQHTPSSATRNLRQQQTCSITTWRRCRTPAGIGAVRLHLVHTLLGEIECRLRVGGSRACPWPRLQLDDTADREGPGGGRVLSSPRGLMNGVAPESFDVLFNSEVERFEDEIVFRNIRKNARYTSEALAIQL